MMFLLVLEFIKCLWWLIGLLSNYHNKLINLGGGDGGSSMMAAWPVAWASWLMLVVVVGVSVAGAVGAVVFLGGMVEDKKVSSRWVEVSVQIYCYRLRYQRPMMELLSLTAVMSEGLGFNLCVAPFLNICVPNLPQGVKDRECQRWLELGWRCHPRVGWGETKSEVIVRMKG